MTTSLLFRTNTTTKFAARAFLILLFVLIQFSFKLHAQKDGSTFHWPEGKSAAISLSFDDARASQVNGGTALLDQYKAKATFYVQPSNVKSQLAGWKQAVASGHEIGNHTDAHPCSGNFAWSRSKALENYSLDQMKRELSDANVLIESLLGVTCKSFAYPCGQTFVGRGTSTKSYIPVVAEQFVSGRGWMNESGNDPAFCDLSQLMCFEADGKTFQEILPILKTAVELHQWVVLGGHEMGEEGPQTTRLSMLKELIAYVQDPANGLWFAPVGTVADYLKSNRK